MDEAAGCRRGYTALCSAIGWVRASSDLTAHLPTGPLFSIFSPARPLFFCQVAYVEKTFKNHKRTNVQEQEEEHEYHDG